MLKRCAVDCEAERFPSASRWGTRRVSSTRHLDWNRSIDRFWRTGYWPRVREAPLPLVVNKEIQDHTGRITIRLQPTLSYSVSKRRQGRHVILFTRETTPTHARAHTRKETKSDRSQAVSLCILFPRSFLIYIMSAVDKHHQHPRLAYSFLLLLKGIFDMGTISMFCGGFC
jgi:hypothetical protein